MSNVTKKQKIEKLRRSIEKTLEMMRAVNSETFGNGDDSFEFGSTVVREKRRVFMANQRKRIINLKRQADYFSRKLAELEAKP